MAELHIGQILLDSIKKKSNLSVKSVAEMLHITEQGLYKLFTKDDVYIKRVIAISQILGEDLLYKISQAANEINKVEEGGEPYSLSGQIDKLNRENQQLREKNQQLKDEILSLYRRITKEH